MHNTEVEPLSRTLIEAIARNRVVTAVYNGGELALAPQRLFARHGALHVSAVNTGRPPRDDEAPRLGLFKLAGLSDVRLTDSKFEPVPAGSDAPIRPTDEVVFPL